MRIALLTTAACLFLAPYGNALAQDAAPLASESDGALGDIVVTAQRRSQNLQETPVAVTALSAEQLESRGVRNVYDLANVTPSLQLSANTPTNGSNAVVFVIRGLGQQGGEPSVGLYLDDFAYPTATGNVLKALDVTQIEVLRGPQGTLFGRNTIGGAVRYTTRKPDGDFGGYLEGTAGSFERTDFIGALNVPLGDMLAVRLTAASFEQDGFQERANDDGANGASEDDLYRAQVRFTPTENLTVDLSYESLENSLVGFPVYVPTIGVTVGPGAFWNARFDPDYTQAYASPSITEAYGGLPRDSFSNSTAHHTHGTIDYRVNDSLELKYMIGRSVIDGEFYNDIDASPLAVGDQGGDSRIKFLSHEIQALGDVADRLHYVFGAYYFEQQGLAHNSQNFAAPPGLPFDFLRPRSTSASQRYSSAAYGNVTFDVTEKLSLTGGLRFGSESSNVNGFEAEWDQTLPLVRAQYQWSPEIMTYVSASNGFRSGGFNVVTATNTIIPYDPEDVWSYEFGTRAELFDRHLRFNPTIFYTSYDKMQISRIPVGGTAAILENAGKSHIYGLELETLAQITSQFSLTAAISYLKGEYDELLPGVTSVTLDTPFARTPEWFYSVGAQYRVPFENGAGASFSVDYSYRTDQWASATQSDTLPIPAYGLLNANAQYESSGGAWTFSVFANNLTDEEYFVGGLDLRPVTGTVRYDIGRPREIGARVRVNF